MLGFHILNYRKAFDKKKDKSNQYFLTVGKCFFFLKRDLDPCQFHPDPQPGLNVLTCSSLETRYIRVGPLLKLHHFQLLQNKD